MFSFFPLFSHYMCNEWIFHGQFQIQVSIDLQIQNYRPRPNRGSDAWKAGCGLSASCKLIPGVDFTSCELRYDFASLRLIFASWELIFASCEWIVCELTFASCELILWVANYNINSQFALATCKMQVTTLNSQVLKSQLAKTTCNPQLGTTENTMTLKVQGDLYLCHHRSWW